MRVIARLNTVAKKIISPPKKSECYGLCENYGYCFWETEGILIIEYKDKVDIIMGEYYFNLLRWVKEALKNKRRGKLSKGVLLL